MKIISFLSKFTFLCNIAFVVFVAVNKFGPRDETQSLKPGISEFTFLKNLVITLGFSAIIINLLMCMAYATILLMRRKNLLPKWLALVNFLFLLFQFYFYFV